jgi:cell division protein FtsI/penicillin-binding protein 2
VTKGRYGGKPVVRALSVLAALLAVWGISRAVSAANRHQLPPPSQALPAQDEQQAFAHGLAPEDLRQLLAVGLSEGTTPNGAKVTLTLDPNLQKAVFDLFRRFDPPYGVFAAMEPKTGKVLALVGYRKGGEYDPWLPLKAIYPAASLIKVVTAAAALEKGSISPEEEISYRGGIYRITRKGLHTRGGRGVPTMTLEEAIAKSSNSVFGKVTVDYVGSKALEEFMERFGFGQEIPFGLPVEVSNGYVPSDEYRLARTGAGFGEVYVSPLHMAMIMSAIGSSGEMPRPILIESVEDKDGDPLYDAVPSKWRDTVSPETAEALLKMMVKTIEMGTSRRTFGTPDSTPMLRDMEVAGKTGSLSGWNPRMRFEWFAGVAPVKDPKIAVAALVVNSNHWKIKGSYVGKEAMSSYFGYPQSTPPAYAKRRAKKKVRAAAKKKGANKMGAASKKPKKSQPEAKRAPTSPRSSVPSPTPRWLSYQPFLPGGPSSRG